MRPDMLPLLRDPLSGEPLELAGGAVSSDGRILEGQLKGPSTTYSVVNGIPRFVAEEYSASFGLQWNRFAEVQLDSKSGRSTSDARFRTETGWAERDLRGKVVVDAGCGSGRFAEIAASMGAHVIAIDMSSAVDAAEKNLAGYRDVTVVQADLGNLPLDMTQVDLAYSIGVMQHTPYPLDSARTFVRSLGPGCRFAITAYARRPWTLLNGKYLLRPLTRRVNEAKLLEIVETSMPVLFPLTNILYRLPFLGRAFRFLIPVANYVEDADTSRQLRYQEAVLDTFDMLSPAHDHPLKWNEACAVLSDLAALTLVSKRPLIVRGVRY